MKCSWLLLPLALTACDDDFDRVSEVKTVRVLGVRKSPTYPAPGETVTHTMLWHDGRVAPTRPVVITWLGGCHNPPGDQYLGCFEALASSLQSGDQLGTGDRFDLTVPSDILDDRPPNPDPNQSTYGTSLVFFAACAGTLGLDPASPPGELPLGCFDEAGARLGADDFVLGYTTTYATTERENAAPIVTGFRIAGREVPVDCVDDACLDAPASPPRACDAGDPSCVYHCVFDGDDADCPAIRIEPIVAEGSVELDPVASAAKGTPTYEQVWVDYFADRGQIGAELRLIGGADDGPRADYSSELFTPAARGPLRIWAVVKDSRGGVSWVRVQLEVF